MNVPVSIFCDFEDLLRSAMKAATENVPNVAAELMEMASKAADAIRVVSHGQAELKLSPIQADAKSDLAVYNLELKSEAAEVEPMSVGVYGLSEGGYPIQRWYSISSWRAKPDKPNKLYSNHSELRDHFAWIVGNRESRLVVQVIFILQVIKEKERREAATRP